MDDQKAPAIQDVSGTMAELRAKIRGLPESVVQLKPTAEDWTIGQILTHVAMSHRFSIDQIEFGRRGQPITREHFAPNLAALQEALSQSLAEIDSRLVAEQQRLLSWLQSQPAESWAAKLIVVLPWETREVSLAGIGDRLKAHYADHLHQIDDWLARTGQKQVAAG